MGYCSSFECSWILISFFENIAYKWVVLATFGMKRPFLVVKFAFFLELCIVLSVVVHFFVDNRLVFYEAKGEDWRVF